MQIPYDPYCDLETYVEGTNDKEKRKKWLFPDYKDCCPLCHGKDCPRRHGFYYRRKAHDGIKYYEDIAIVRYLCHQTGPIKPEHRTFSLLPIQLIPYHQNALKVVCETVSYQHKTGATAEQTKRVIATKGRQDYLSLENNQLLDFKKIFVQAFNKLMTLSKLKQQIQQADDYDSSKPIRSMISIIESYNSPFSTIGDSNAEILATDFFANFQTSCYFDRNFLFGSPSQKRI